MGHTLYTTLYTKKVPRCFVHSNPASMLFFSFSLSHVAGGGITIIVEEFIGAKFTNNFFPSLYTTLLYTKPLQQNEDRKQKAEAPRQGKKVTILLGCKKKPLLLTIYMPGTRRICKNTSQALQWWWRQILHVSTIFSPSTPRTYTKNQLLRCLTAKNSCKQKHKKFSAYYYKDRPLQPMLRN